MKISENQRKVLAILTEDEEMSYFFRFIATETGLEERVVRLACRALKRKGLAKHVTGLVDDDGLIAGSGYSATEEGVKFLTPNLLNGDKIN